MNWAQITGETFVLEVPGGMVLSDVKVGVVFVPGNAEEIRGWINKAVSEYKATEARVG